MGLASIVPIPPTSDSTATPHNCRFLQAFGSTTPVLPVLPPAHQSGSYYFVVPLMSFIIPAFVVFIGLVLVLVKLTRRFASPQYLPVTAGWIEELSIERYRPMLRLLNKEDLDFLRAQPGFTPRMATDFRIQRCHLLLEYLRALEIDFKRICTALKVLMVQAEHDRPDLASVLLRNEMTFAYGMTVVQFQLVFYRYGVGTVDATDLVKLFDGLRLELRTLVPAESWAGA